MSSRSLVTGEDVADPACSKGVVQRQRGAARHAEDRVDPTFGNRFDQGIGGTHSQLLPYR